MAAKAKAPAKKAATRKAPANKAPAKKAATDQAPVESTPGADGAAAQNPDTAGDQTGDDQPKAAGQADAGDAGSQDDQAGTGDQAGGDDGEQDKKDPPPAPAAKAKQDDEPQGALIKVEAKTDSFWRAGAKWSRKARVVPVSAFTEEQLQQLKDEPLLVVTPVDSETLDDD